MVTRIEHLIERFDKQLFQRPKERDERLLRSIWKNLKSELEAQEESLKRSHSALKLLIESKEKYGYDD